MCWEQPVQHADETGWTEAKQRAGLWVVVAAQVAVFLLDRRRGAHVARRLLSEVRQGILISDRWSDYHWIPAGQRQDLLGSFDPALQRLCRRRRAGPTHRDRSADLRQKDV